MPTRLSELIAFDIGEKFIAEFVKTRSRNRPRAANRAKKPLAFVSRAQRAFDHVARKLWAENPKLGLPAVVSNNGKRAVIR
jgi:hypothetical protein